MSADKQQIPHRKRPELCRYFFGEQRVYPVRFLKIGGHFCAELISSHPHVDGKAQLVPDFVLDLMRQRNRIGIGDPGPGKIAEELVDGKLLYHRSVAPADILECLRAGGVELEIRRRDRQGRAFPQRHGKRLSSFYLVFFRGYRLRQHDAAPGLRVPANAGRDQAQIVPAVFDPPRRLPGKKGAVHIDMKD